MDAERELDLGKTWARCACHLSGLSCPEAKSSAGTLRLSIGEHSGLFRVAI